jgi:hypothetical protein
LDASTKPHIRMMISSMDTLSKASYMHISRKLGSLYMQYPPKAEVPNQG